MQTASSACEPSVAAPTVTAQLTVQANTNTTALSEEGDVNKSGVAGTQGVLPSRQAARHLTLLLWCDSRLTASGRYVVSDTFTVHEEP